MFPVKPDHVRRLNFVSKIYPNLSSPLGTEFARLGADDHDGELFLRGKSRNKDLLSFFGFISKSQRGASSHVQLPLFRRCQKKLVSLVEQELESIGAQEMLMPTLIPKKLWLRSKRVERQPDALDSVYQLTDRNEIALLLGPTFEESTTQLVGDLDASYEHQLPLMLYQTSQKFRDEMQPRFGLLRSSEFLMNDLYSFDATLDNAKATYTLMTSVYERIFKRLGLDCIRCESNPGDIGGTISHEFQLPLSSGEDMVVRCRSCNHSYNIEMSNSTDIKDEQDSSRAVCIKCKNSNVDSYVSLELAHTFLLSDTYTRPMNVSIKASDGGRRFYEMGCYGLGLTRILGAGLDLFSIGPKQSAESSDIPQMRWPSETEPYKFGLVTPAKRSKQYHGGSSDFVEKMVLSILDRTSHEVDILIEDRDKEGISRRVAKLQSIGIPNIIVVGKRFLDDPPMFEVLSLTKDKQNYDQHWFTEEQLYDYIQKR